MPLWRLFEKVLLVKSYNVPHYCGVIHQLYIFIGILLAEFVVGLILVEQQRPDYYLNLPLDHLSSILGLLNKVTGQLPEQFLEREMVSWPGIFGNNLRMLFKEDFF